MLVGEQNFDDDGYHNMDEFKRSGYKPLPDAPEEFGNNTMAPTEFKRAGYEGSGDGTMGTPNKSVNSSVVEQREVMDIPMPVPEGISGSPTMVAEGIGESPKGVPE